MAAIGHQLVPVGPADVVRSSSDRSAFHEHGLELWNDRAMVLYDLLEREEPGHADWIRPNEHP